MARKLLVEITMPEGVIGEYWNAMQLLRFLANSVEAAEGDELGFALVSDTHAHTFGTTSGKVEA